MVLLNLALYGCHGGVLGTGPSPAQKMNTLATHDLSLGGQALNAVAAAKQAAIDGPPTFAARVSACRKTQISTFRQILAQWQVDLTPESDDSPGSPVDTLMQRYAAGLGHGAPDIRKSEAQQVNTVTLGLTYDVLIAAAPEIIANAPTSPACMHTDAPNPLFDTAGSCLAPGLSCLLGMPATEAHVAICNQIVAAGATPAAGQQLAVASLLAAELTCE